MKTFIDSMIVEILDSGKLWGSRLGCLYPINKRFNDKQNITNILTTEYDAESIISLEHVKDNRYKVVFNNRMIYSSRNINQPNKSVTL